MLWFFAPIVLVYLLIVAFLIRISYNEMGPRVLWTSWLWPLTTVEELISEWRHRK